MTSPAQNRQTNRQSPRTIADLLSQLLDRTYARQAETVINAYARELKTGRLATRLTQLEQEAARLKSLGLPLKADNPVLRAVVADFEAALTEQRALINVVSGALNESGVNAGISAAQQFALPGDFRGFGVGWNRPDPQAIASLIDTTNKPAWGEMLNRYEQGIGETVNRIAVRGIVEGKSPLAIAAEIRGAVQSIPLSAAENIMRTVQLDAYRQATSASYVQNADILEPYAIRVAALDARTCLACVALHGTLVPIGEPIAEHWRGRCTTIAQVRGRRRAVQTGQTWFDALSDAQKQAQMGYANYEAYKAGRIKLIDFVQKRDDPVFGKMIQEASLKGVLGAQAKRFYKNAS